MRYGNWFFACGLAITGLILGGCGGGNALKPVTGKVTLEDGSALPEVDPEPTITFQPVRTESQGYKAASATIQPDGTYALETTEGLGAYRGKYKVTFNVMVGYPNKPKQMIAEEYTDAKTTPFEREVTDGENKFDFKLKKAKK